ncbi:MAG: hypothetical protein OTI34_11835, partial [Lewinella sp.]|nr:hypothetical protein [Lewinella sp.]
MVNSCIEHPDPNGGQVSVESEISIMRTGVLPIPVNTIRLDLPFNGFGPQNDDLGYDLNGIPLGYDYKEPTIPTLSGCSGAIPAGPDDVTPEVFVCLPFQIGCSLVQGTSGPMTTDGTVQLTFSQENKPYQLTYSGADAGAIDVNGASFDLAGLPAEDYTFSASDANGCASENCILTVPQANPLIINCRTRNNSND